VLATWSVSWPPLAVPPLSCTWKVKLPYGVPLACWRARTAAGRQGCRWPTRTSQPSRQRRLIVSVPLSGSVAILTFSSELAVVSARVAEAEIGLREGVGGVLVGRDGLVRRRSERRSRR